jgi:hypothetical protein
MGKPLPKFRNPPAPKKIINEHKTVEQVRAENEDEFLAELIMGKKKWTARGEKEYADAYKVLINKFTQLPEES